MAELRPEVAEAVHTINCSRTSQQEVKAAWYLVHEELQRLTNKLDHLNTTNQAAIVDAQGNVRYYHARIWKKMNNDLEAAYATIKRLTDENARLLQDEGDALTALQEEHEWQEEHARALKAEAERDALRKRIEDAPMATLVYGHGDMLAVISAENADDWAGKQVRLLSVTEPQNKTPTCEGERFGS